MKERLIKKRFKFETYYFNKKIDEEIENIHV